MLRINIAKYMLLLNLLPVIALSQSDQYWSQNFNVGSSLLSGAVVGGKAGVSAIYYNPAQIGHDSTLNFAFSVNLISLQFYNIKNFAGDGVDMYKFNFKLQPKFISYVFQPGKSDRLFVELSFLSRASDEVAFNVRHSTTLNIIKRLDGDENYTGTLVSYRSYNDSWFGAGVSYKLNSNWSLGTSLFISIKSLDYIYDQSMIAFQTADSIFVNGVQEPYYFAESSYGERLKYWYLNLIPKFGLHYRSDNQSFGFGLNLTFPNIGIYGEAEIDKKITRSGVHDDDMGNFTPDLVMLEEQRKVRTTIKDPFSVAVGFVLKSRNQRTVGMISAEYFNEIPVYRITDNQNQLSNSNDAIKALLDGKDVMNFYYGAAAVTNISLGFMQHFTEKFSLLGGFRTDFSSASFLGDELEANEPKTFKINTDKFHLTGGPYFHWQRFNIFLGLQYTFSKVDDLEQIINFTEPVEYNPDSGESLQGVRDNTMRVNYNELSLFFGITYKTVKAD
jgi:hypothetical protein